MTTTTLPAIQVEIANVNGQLVPAITSLHVAEVFGKRHDNVLIDVQNILSQVSENFLKLNFQEYEWEQKVGFGTRKNKGYLLTRDGFSMLAMGYNGKKAFQFKEAILARLNELEAKAQQTSIPNFADPVAAARAWADALEQKRETEQQLALVAPKAEVYDTVVADKDISLYAFARKLTGLNCQHIKQALAELGFLYKTKYTPYRVYSEYRGVLFDEKLVAGKNDITVLDAGKKKLAQLYKQGLLGMRKSHLASQPK